MSRILITGATGFVGGHVCRALRADGHTLSGATRQKDKGQGPEDIPLYHVPEIGPDTDWSRIVVAAEIVVHLAARVHIMKDPAKNPLAEYRRVNEDGTRRLAECAVQAGVKRFIFVSTVKVNGDESFESPFEETDSVDPEDAYAVSKWRGEQALTKIADGSEMEVVILRPPLVYGPGVGGNFLRLLKAVHRRLPLPLGGIDNSRSLLGAENLASAIALCATHADAAGETFLVSDNQDISTPDLIRLISASMGQMPNIWNVPLGVLRLAGLLTGKSAAINRLTGSLVVNSRKIRVKLGWEPPVTLADGLHDAATRYLKSDAGK